MRVKSLFLSFDVMCLYALLLEDCYMANINGGDGHDTLNGTADADLIRGGLGLDRINGEGGNDTISGGRNSDTLSRIWNTSCLKCFFFSNPAGISVHFFAAALSSHNRVGSRQGDPKSEHT